MKLLNQLFRLYMNNTYKIYYTSAICSGTEYNRYDKNNCSMFNNNIMYYIILPIDDIAYFQFLY
jgi:hypothetical protein